MTNESVETKPTLLIPLQRGERKDIPSRRQTLTTKVKIGGQSFYMHSGEFADGELAEIFLTAGKTGTFTKGVIDALGIAISKGLQYGVPLEEFVESFAFVDFPPNGIVQGDDDIKMANSFIDWVVRRLAIDYLDRNDLKSGGGDDS